MEKGNLKEGRKEKKKAKKYEGHRDQKSVAMARKFSQSETLPKGQKRARDSDGENCQRDISSKEGKKIKKETVVERTEECNSTTGNYQSKGEQKERVSKGKLKPRKRTQEPTSSEKSKQRNFGEEQLVSFGKEDKFRENSDQESLDKEKRKKNSRGNDNYSAQNEEEHENRENSTGKHDKKLKKSTIVVGKKRTKKKPDDNAFFEEQKHYIFDTQSNEGLHEEMLETCEDAVKAEMNNEGKKKKKKSKQELQKESKSALHPAIDYLHTWFNNRQHWNFKKVRQVWLLKNMFDQEQVSEIN